MSVKVAYGRRTSADPEWKKCKEEVRKRDHGRCVFQECLSVQEAYQLKVDGPTACDAAHIFSASQEPSQIYNPKNVVTLQRFIHRRMDSYKNPVTGADLDGINEHYYWWWRIFKKTVATYDPDFDYKNALKQEIFTEK